MKQLRIEGAVETSFQLETRRPCRASSSVFPLSSFIDFSFSQLFNFSTKENTSSPNTEVTKLNVRTRQSTQKHKNTQYRTHVWSYGHTVLVHTVRSNCVLCGFDTLHFLVFYFLPFNIKLFAVIKASSTILNPVRQILI